LGFVSVAHAESPIPLEIGIPVDGNFNTPSEVKEFLIEIPQPGLFSLKFNFFVEFNTDLWKASLISIDENGRQTMIDIFYAGNYRINSKFENQTKKIKLSAGNYLLRLQTANSDWEHGYIYDFVSENYRGTSYKSAMMSQYSMTVLFEEYSDTSYENIEYNSYTLNQLSSSEQELLEIFNNLTDDEKEQLINFGTLLLLLRTVQ